MQRRCRVVEIPQRCRGAEKIQRWERGGAAVM